MEVLIKLSDAIKTLKSMAVPLVRKLPSAQPERLTDYSFEESCTECPAYDTENHRCPRFNQVIRTALKDANLEPCENCISRQAALNALDEQIRQCDKALSAFDISMKDAYAVKVERASLVAFRETLEYMPSVQPEKRTEKRTETHARDLIDRQAAIDALKNRWKKTRNYEGIGNDIAEECELYLKQVPSAQPEWHESPKNALYIRKADAIEICMEQIESPINTYFEKGTAEIIKEKITELPSAQPNLDEWCTDCKEYDHEKHCCPRFNRVIRDTLNEVEPMRKRGTWMHDKDDVLISGYCSCCGWESIIMETDVADMPFCPNCGADMRGGQE